MNPSAKRIRNPEVNHPETVAGRGSAAAGADSATSDATGAKPAQPRREPKRTYTKSGIHTMKAAMKSLGNRTHDRRTKGVKRAEAFRAAMVADMGGEERLSAAQLHLIDQMAIDKLMLESMNAFLAEQKSPINRRKRVVLPVFWETQKLAASISNAMQLLGLERAPGVKDKHAVGRLTKEELERVPTKLLEACVRIMRTFQDVAHGVIDVPAEYRSVPAPVSIAPIEPDPHKEPEALAKEVPVAAPVAVPVPAPPPVQPAPQAEPHAATIARRSIIENDLAFPTTKTRH